jgi:hypothetical protein
MHLDLYIANRNTMSSFFVEAFPHPGSLPLVRDVRGRVSMQAII